MLYEKMSQVPLLQRISGIFTTERMGNFLFEYDTPKVVKVYSVRIGGINRTIQFLVLLYIIGYVFIFKKGYQSSEKAESNTVAKVKGMIRTNFSRSSGANNVWDPTDLVIPSVENDAAFITTNFIQTPSQQTGICAEDPSVKTARCKTDKDCPTGEMIKLGNGFRTGRCLNDTGTCEIEGWCPTERDNKPDPPLFMEAKDFTILVKNYIVFPNFNVTRRNIPDTFDDKKLGNCTYHPEKDPLCPIFVVKDLIEYAGENFSDIARSGAIIAFIIEWECNLDYSADDCMPVYKFRRMDREDLVQGNKPKVKVAKGWNFRHADYWNAPDGSRRRTLYKYYGVRFIFTVYGEAWKFSAEDFAMNLGSGIGLMGIATYLCDVLTEFLLKSDAYRTRKTDRVRDERDKKPAALETMLQHVAETSPYAVTSVETSDSDDSSEDDSSNEDEDRNGDIPTNSSPAPDLKPKTERHSTRRKHNRTLVTEI